MDYPVIDVTATGRNIGTMIRRSNYSVPDGADYLGTTPSLVDRYIRGDVLPSTDRLLALSRLMDVTINDLILTL